MLMILLKETPAFQHNATLKKLQRQDKSYVNSSSEGNSETLSP